MAFERPATYEWRNVVQFITDTKPVIARESEYIDKKYKQQKDLVSLRAKSVHASLGALIETCLNHLRRSSFVKASSIDVRDVCARADR